MGWRGHCGWQLPAQSARPPAHPPLPAAAAAARCRRCCSMLGLVFCLLSASLSGLKPKPGQGATSGSQALFWTG